jgi:hypothetical protein
MSEGRSGICPGVPVPEDDVALAREACDNNQLPPGICRLLFEKSTRRVKMGCGPQGKRIDIIFALTEPSH